MIMPMRRATATATAAAVSQVVGALLLILVIGVSVMGIYLASEKLSGEEARDSASRMMFQLSLEEIIPLRDEVSPGTCYGLKIVVRNSGTDPAPLDGLVLYVEEKGRIVGTLTPIGIPGNRILPPGSAVDIIFITKSQNIGSGDARFRLAGRFSTSDSLSSSLPCKLAPSTVLKVSLLNDASSPANTSLGSMVIKAWTEAVGGHSGFWVKVSLVGNVSLPPGALRIQLLSARDYEPVEGSVLRVFHNSGWIRLASECREHEEHDEDDEHEDHQEHHKKTRHHGEGDDDDDHHKHRKRHRGNGEKDDDYEECSEESVLVSYWTGVPAEAFPLAVLVSLVG